MLAQRRQFIFAYVDSEGSAAITAALSLDLRHRVIAAMEAGASFRKAAERFGIGAATAIRWQTQVQRDGRIAAKPTGGDHASHRVEGQAP